jgi:arsenate reductase (thioredoxin)
MFDKPKVLFLCTGHPERSEMAEGFLRSFAGESMIPVSAAIEPAPVSPLAVDTMKEVGIDISRQQIKDVKEPSKSVSHTPSVWAINQKNVVPFFPLHFGFSAGAWRIRPPCKAPLKSALLHSAA